MKSWLASPRPNGRRTIYSIYDLKIRPAIDKLHLGTPARYGLDGTALPVAVAK